jgi:hypothetical protein
MRCPALPAQGGVDYKAMRDMQGGSLRDIAHEWSRNKRERKGRLVEVMVEGMGKVQVLHENLYTIQVRWGG